MCGFPSSGTIPRPSGDPFRRGAFGPGIRSQVMDYQLKPIGKSCFATGRELLPGMRCHSALVEQNGRLVRIDYAEEAWKGPPEGTVGHWSCTVPEAEMAKAPPLDSAAMMRYFEQLSEEPNPAREKFRFILALLLLQKRKLRIEGTREEDGTEYLQLAGSRGEGPFEIPNQQLDDEEMNRLQEELSTHLAVEWS